MSLVRIYNEDSEIVFYENASIKVLYKSPFFQIENELSITSYSFSIPALKNQQFFKFANLLDIRKGVYIYEVNIDICNDYKGKGLLLVEQYRVDEYLIKFTLDRGAYALALDKSIRSFSFNKPSPYRYRIDGDRPNISYRDYEFSFSSTPPSGPSVYTVVTIYSNFLKQDIVFDAIYTPSQTLADHIDLIVTKINEGTAKHCVQSVRQTSSTIRVWDLAFNDNYVDITFEPKTIDWYDYFNDVVLISSSHPDPVQAEFLHYNEVIANPENYDYIFFPVRTENLALSGFDFKKTINHYYPANVSPGPSVNGIRTGGNNWVRDNLLMPYAYLWHTIEQLFKEIKVEIINDFFDDELKKLVFFTPLFMNLFKNNNTGGMVTRNWTYSSILPDVKLGELLTELKIYFGMISDFDSKKNTVRFISRKTVFESTEVKDWTAKILFNYNSKRDPVKHACTTVWPESEVFSKTRIYTENRLTKQPNVDLFASLPNDNLNDFRLVFKENNHYRKYSDFVLSAWEFYKEGLEDYKPTGFDNEIPSNISTLFNYKGETEYTTDGKIFKMNLPWTAQNFSRYDSQSEKIPIHLLFYRGMQPAMTQEGASPDELTERSAPAGSYHNYNYLGVKIGNYNLSWNHPDGLISVFQKDFFYTLENSDPVSFRLTLNGQDIADLNLLEKKKLGNQVVLIDELEVVFSDVIETATVKAYPIKSQFND